MKHRVINGDKEYEFDTVEERDAYLASLPKVWSKEQHLAEINAMHSQEFDRRWRELEYEGRWEVSDASRDESLEHHEEAKELMKYWNYGWFAIKTYRETVTEQNAQDPIVFISSI